MPNGTYGGVGGGENPLYPIYSINSDLMLSVFVPLYPKKDASRYGGYLVVRMFFYFGQFPVRLGRQIFIPSFSEFLRHLYHAHGTRP